jgi:hypothetical protein
VIPDISHHLPRHEPFPICSTPYHSAHGCAVRMDQYRCWMRSMMEDRATKQYLSSCTTLLKASPSESDRIKYIHIHHQLFFHVPHCATIFQLHHAALPWETTLPIRTHNQRQSRNAKSTSPTGFTESPCSVSTTPYMYPIAVR